ncbi:MAG: beta-galactosidase, partial [Bacteroidales bacterium]|nr:beta-galactosidase [Bacteroidales bacterium]
MRNYCIVLVNILLIIFPQAIRSQHVYTLNIDIPEKDISHDHLKLGGTNFKGNSIEVNSYYLQVNNKPVLPVTGEFHFSRYPDKYWEESIRKMKAGGIDYIATYVFWSMHEETEGIFKWDGMNNLRKFIELCEKYEFDVIVRIGPFCHGEIRNGGLPDWLLGKPLTIRSNDPNYLFYVERLYEQIGKQLEGLLFRDGGPVIGIQLENEFQHSAAPWGLTYPGQPHDYTAAEQDRATTQEGVSVAEGDNPYAEMGNEHMRILKALALKAGLTVPLYTATGWGYAAIIENETLPVAAAYPFPTWAPEQPSEFYLYKDLQKDPDYAPVRYQAENYPCIAAEIGGGIMNTYSRRPLIPPNSLDPMINRFLGSGANGIGYYMYHGG